MTIVAIHQPNFMPWLGYFWKIARADIFVFLDDVQYSKNGYINRVRILGSAGPRWLTVPVSVRFGDTIAAARPSQPDWPQRHRDMLSQCYRRAPHFRDLWPEVEALYANAPDANLAAINRFCIERLAVALGLSCRYLASSTLDTGAATSDERLVRIMQAIAPGGTYLSGRSGSTYQDERKFRDAGVRLVYTDFIHPAYAQGAGDFVSGLSILDALFHCGCDTVAGWLKDPHTGAQAVG